MAKANTKTITVAVTDRFGELRRAVINSSPDTQRLTADVLPVIALRGTNLLLGAAVDVPQGLYTVIAPEFWQDHLLVAALEHGQELVTNELNTTTTQVVDPLLKVYGSQVVSVGGANVLLGNAVELAPFISPSGNDSVIATVKVYDEFKDADRDLPFQPGLTIVFGRGGTGKSVLLRALSTALGTGITKIGEPEADSAPFSAAAFSTIVTRAIANGGLQGKPVLIDSLRFLTGESGAAMKGGFSRGVIDGIGLLNDFAQEANAAVIAVMNPLLDDPEALNAAFRLIADSVVGVIHTTAADEASRIVTAEVSFRSLGREAFTAEFSA